MTEPTKCEIAKCDKPAVEWSAMTQHPLCAEHTEEYCGTVNDLEKFLDQLERKP